MKPLIGRKTPLVLVIVALFASLSSITPMDPVSAQTGVSMALSHNSAPPGRSVTVEVTGVASNSTVTVWLDSDGDGIRDPSERDLCWAQATNNFVSCTFALFNPPFDPGTGTDCASASLGSTFDCNYINAIDGQGQVLTRLSQSDLDRSIVHLETADLSLDKSTTFTGPVGERPNRLILDDAHHMAYVENEDGNTVSVIDTRTNILVTTDSRIKIKRHRFLGFASLGSWKRPYQAKLPIGGRVAACGLGSCTSRVGSSTGLLMPWGSPKGP